MALTPGARLRPYEIQCALGAGGMGEAYRVRDTRLGRAVAIKILSSHVSDDPTIKERFERDVDGADGVTSVTIPFADVLKAAPVGDNRPAHLADKREKMSTIH